MREGVCKQMKKKKIQCEKDTSCIHMKNNKKNINNQKTEIFIFFGEKVAT